MSKVYVAALVVALLLLPLVVHNTYILHVMIVIAINVIMAVSMWLLGITGLISFGQAGFMFIGAMTTALLTKNAGWLGEGRASTPSVLHEGKAWMARGWPPRLRVP
jgi:branched-chain amino acid transport system permease protein